MSDLPLPVTFREEIVKVLLENLMAHRSCSLVGVGSSGKSNVVRHISRSDVLEHYLGDDARHVLILYVNCAGLTENTGLPLYCAILEAIEDAVKKARPEATGLLSRFKELWESALGAGLPDLARRNVARALDLVFRELDVQQLFVIFDDFDKVIAEMPAPVLRSLRALRDDHKTQIKYVTVTRRELGFLRDRREIEDFFELIAPNTLAIGPYSETDARFMIARLAAREVSPPGFSDQEIEFLLEVSGRHAGLLASIYNLTRDTKSFPDYSFEIFSRQGPILAECEKIWDGLEESERRKLEDIVCGYQPSRDEMRALVRKGVARVRPNGTYYVFSPVFADFIENSLRRRLAIQLLPGQSVEVHNRTISDLSVIEYQLLSCLWHQFPRPATPAQLLNEMLAAEAGTHKVGGPPARRLQGYLEGLRRKIGLEHILELPDGCYVLCGPGDR
ncbi:MAG: hypothetical protein Kow0063_25100 [Anaerolineae bacterium]